MLTTLLTVSLATVSVETQHLQISLDPAAHQVVVDSRLESSGAGVLRLRLSDQAEISSLQVDGHPVAPTHADGMIELPIAGPSSTIDLRYRATFESDVAAGERPGQIHNFSVDAHVGPDGIFLSDGSDWHPRPIGPDGHVALHPISVEIATLENGWAVVASGDPVTGGALDEPCWTWRTPRPVDGMAIVGNRHELHGVVHETAEGPVEIVMHVPATHSELAGMFIEAARAYLDLYVPRLGPFPYRRFSIVENFFSSGFAFPGFTVLGPQVVGMAPRWLAPGYLDHELLHNWWGNGVYVDPDDGNWCEAVTSYGANYWRRIADDGEEAGRDYRRGILMKLSTDPASFNDGPLRAFGSARRGVDRFVGYDKGAFVFHMLSREVGGHDAAWAALRRFAVDHMGTRAGWSDIQYAFEAARPDLPGGWLDGFFAFWIDDVSCPQTGAREFTGQYPQSLRAEFESETAADRTWVEFDPDFHLYRVLPPGQLIPTIAGTTGPDGVHLITGEPQSRTAGLLARLELDDDGENLMLIGADAIREHRDLIARTADPLAIADGSFTVAGTEYDGVEQAVLHTMPHPDRPGRFITAFHSNGEAGWSRLRLIMFYTRDTTIVWSGDRVLERRVFEPSRRMTIPPDDPSP